MHGFRVYRKPGADLVALQNLIQNAAYRRLDVPPPVIWISGQAMDEGVVARATDNGKGISEKDRHKVLEPLVRLHGEGDPAGTGLGLATCAQIAGAQGGRRDISRDNGGTTVSLYLHECE